MNIKKINSNIWVSVIQKPKERIRIISSLQGKLFKNIWKYVAVQGR